jgi:hypothetical protein
MDVKQKAWQSVNILRSLKFTLDRKLIEIIYMSFIRPILEYVYVVWDNITVHVVVTEELMSIQIKAAIFVIMHFYGWILFISIYSAIAQYHVCNV